MGPRRALCRDRCLWCRGHSRTHKQEYPLQVAHAQVPIDLTHREGTIPYFLLPTKKGTPDPGVEETSFLTSSQAELQGDQVGARDSASD